MSFAESIAFLFFIINIGILITKILNLMTYKERKDGPILKFYGKEIALILFIISILAFFFMLVAFSESTVRIDFLENQGIPARDYIGLAAFLALSGYLMILNGILTFCEVVIMYWDSTKTKLRERWQPERK